MMPVTIGASSDSASGCDRASQLYFFSFVDLFNFKGFFRLSPGAERAAGVDLGARRQHAHLLLQLDEQGFGGLRFRPLPRGA